MKIKINDNIIKHCLDLIEKVNFGKRNKANGTKAQQLVGILGQCVVQDLLGLGLIKPGTGFDGGFDIEYFANEERGLKIDVKTMTRTTDMRDYYVHNFVGLQKDYNNDVYIFCSYNKSNNELTICGWISKEKFLELSNFYPEGSTRTRADGTQFKTFADLYEIKNTDLNPINNIEELTNNLWLHLNSLK